MTADRLEKLLRYVKTDHRVCQNPTELHELWKMLPNKKRVGDSWEPPLPFILAAWSQPAIFKIAILEEHIRYAEIQGVIEEVDTYLQSRV